ncbi:MAG: ABC transporter substrate-binding protein [Acidimicrobiia bacterium]|nr:ABC transporter substrate-binding protein [Acidimicrobiia bacterium]MDH4363437.1 ABC transporter substrate-binding protein [Acidimicrobiia bacterium]
MRRVPVWLVGVAVVAAAAMGALVVALRGGDPAGGTSGGDAAALPWSEVTSRAEGQTVRLWMWGGEAALNAYVDEEVTLVADAAGVTLERVPIDDTAAAMARLAVEADSGDADGAIDLVWVNGKNFEQGKAAGLWLRNWVPSLPNAELLPADDPTLWTDFGVATDGQEMPWSRASFVFAYDPATLPTPPRTFPELLGYARAHPGRVAYPAPPDFTGSAFVRQAVQALGEDEAFALLAELDPLVWGGGDTYPEDQTEIEQLFSAREIDLAMSYNPNFVDVGVERGSFPASVRPYVFDGGTLSNVSFLAVPARASSAEGAMVVANLMLGPDLQAAKADQMGIPSVLRPGECRRRPTPPLTASPPMGGRWRSCQRPGCPRSTSAGWTRSADGRPVV